ncbi:hypothetical protein ACQ4M4_19920 [Leptolyngbya sp. AN02str]|uniref:hypothetical protein n=1 Tax=Leptolyngbya sp. AN02str TaxID=3423363 RepID=UPI003D320B86
MPNILQALLVYRVALVVPESFHTPVRSFSIQPSSVNSTPAMLEQNGRPNR